MKRRGFIGSIKAAVTALFHGTVTAKRELPPDLESLLVRLGDVKRWTAGMRDKVGPPGISLAKKYGRRHKVEPKPFSWP
jgi:hypothetical protein